MTLDSSTSDIDNIIFYDLFQHMHQCVAIYSAVDGGDDFVFTHFNRAAEKQDNIAAKQLIGKRLTECFPSVKEFGLFDVILSVWQSGKPEYLPATLYQDNRISGWRENYIYRLPSGEVVAIYEDVTAQKQAEIDFRESRENLLLLLNSIAEGAYGVDLDGNCTFVNKSFLRILGYSNSDEIIGKHIHEIIHHSHSDGSHYPSSECLMYNAYLNNQEIHRADEVFWNKKGMPIPIEYWASPIIRNGIVTGALATFIDISERIEAEDKLITASLYARSLIEASLDPLVTIDKGGEIMDVNNATEKVTGTPRDKLIGTDFSNYFTQPNKAREGYQSVFKLHHVKDYPLAIRDKSGKITDVLFNASVYRNSKGEVEGVFAAARDITERKIMERKVQQLAFYDDLTQLPNRRLLNDRLKQAIASSERTNIYGALLFLDLDNFKPLNDSYGHTVGDLLLIEVATRLKKCVREVDTVARFGGDEFVVVLNGLDNNKDTTSQKAEAIAEKIRTSLSRPYRLTVKNEERLNEKLIEHHCTASIGISLFLEHEQNLDNIIKQADEAMYLAKSTSRNTIQFYEE